MTVPRLEIQTTSAALGMRTFRPGLIIQQQHANLKIRKPPTDAVEIRSTQGRVLIDQTEAFAAANLKAPLRMASEFSAKSKLVWLDHIAKRGREGQLLRQIENGNKAIQHIAKINSMPQKKSC